MTEEIISIIGDFVELQRGTTYKGSLVGNPGPALLGLGSIAPNGGFREESYKTYGGDCPQKLMVSPGELYVSLKDVTQSANLLGAVARVPKYIGQGRLTQDTVKLVFKNKSIRFSYLYWLLQTPQYRAYCKGRSMGTTNLSLSREDFLSYPIPKFSAAREVLVEILNEVEEKIELNRKQNRSLEAIAQALFKHWFVDFEFPDPQGLPYKSKGGAMQNSELGEIPVGWGVGKLEKIIGELETGSRPKGGVGRFTEGVPSIGAESITRIGEFDYSKTKFVPEEYFVKMRRGIIKDRDVLIYKDGGQPGRFDVRISMFGGGFPFETACLNEHVFRLQAKNPGYQNYLYLWFSSYLILEELRYRGAKAAIPGINTMDVKELNFLFMDEGVLEKFDEVIEPLFLKLLHNSREIAVLSKLRDTLLPKLMSGELRVA